MWFVLQCWINTTVKVVAAETGLCVSIYTGFYGNYEANGKKTKFFVWFLKCRQYTLSYFL